VCDDLDVGSGDVGVAFNKVCAEDRCVELGRCDGLFFGFNVDCVFDRIGGYNYAVVCFCVSEWAC